MIPLKEEEREQQEEKERGPDPLHDYTFLK